MVTLFQMDKKVHLLQSASGKCLDFKYTLLMYKEGYLQKNGTIVTVSSRLKISQFYDILCLLKDGMNAKDFLASKEMKDLTTKYLNGD